MPARPATPVTGVPGIRHPRRVKIREIRCFPVKAGIVPADGDRPEFVYQLIVKVDTDEGLRESPREV